MKNLLLCGLLLSLACGTGCAPRYEVTLANQRTMTSHGKPKFNKENNTFRFTDAAGKEHVIPSFNIREIKPR